MLLIYTHKITKRFTYTMRQIFGEILGIEHSFTTKVEDFIKHSGPKITYTKQPLQNEFFIRSNDLLFEQGINDITIKIQEWDGLPCFFAAGEQSVIPFDIFSASFYLLSRYEEYLPHVKDDLGRFPAKSSFLFKEGILHRPLVDLWAFKFLDLLKERFPELITKPRKFQFQSIINVTTSHCYAHRGIFRNIGGLVIDATRFKFSSIVKRIATWFNPERDPYNNYAQLLELHQKFKVKSYFFFQFAAYSRHDKNVSIFKNRFRHLIKSIADYSKVGLSASYQSAFDTEVLKKEKEQLSNLIKRPVNSVRLRYNKVNIPDSYRKLITLEITDDYSMGYTHQIGFRAGTCTSHFFYDINLEMQQPLKVHPFVLFDYSLIQYKQQQQVFDKLDDVYREVKKLNGTFTIVFSNELFGKKHRLNWLDLYQKLLRRYYV